MNPEWCIKGSEELSKFLSTDPRNKQKFKGENNQLYYYLYDNEWEWNSTSQHRTIITFKEFIEMENKKIIGYTIKDQHEGFVAKLLDISVTNLKNKLDNGCHFYTNGVMYNTLKNAKVLDIWCEPVYKTEPKVFEVDSYDGKIIVRVSKDGILVEDTYVDPRDLSRLLVSLNNNHIDHDTNKRFSTHCNDWSVEVEFVNIGCKKGIPVKQIEEIYNYYKTL